MSDSYDYTATPYDDNPDDFLIGNLTNAAEKDADAVEKENRFLSVPPGEHVLAVAGFFGAPVVSYHKVFVNGQLTGFDAPAISVKFCLPSNKMATISDRFVLPPSDPAGLKAYFYGVPESGQQAGTPSKMQPGILGNRFAHFVNRLGFSWGPGQPFPVEAQRLGTWKGRLIGAKVKPGNGTYRAKDGSEKPRDNSIEWFSYKLAGAVSASAVPGSPAQPRSAGNAAVLVGAASAADAGLDVI